MKRTFVCLAAVFFAVVTIGAQAREEKTHTVELTLQVAKAPQLKDKYQLLPKPEEQSGSDALPLYKKAAESLPNTFNKNLITQISDISANPS